MSAEAYHPPVKKAISHERLTRSSRSKAISKTKGKYEQEKKVLEMIGGHGVALANFAVNVGKSILGWFWKD